MNRKKVGQKILYSPLVKIVVGLIVVAGVVIIGQVTVQKLLNLTIIDTDVKNLIETIATVILAILSIISYSVLYRFYEKRKITEFSVKHIGKNLFTGVILGAVLQSLTILVIYLKGGYIVISVNPVFFIVPSLTMAFFSAIFEETLCRGILFRIIEEKLGSYTALFISALIFGFLHLLNPGSSLIIGIGLAVQAGLLLAAAYIYSRNLWFPIAVHFAWNFTQGGIFGANVSGGRLSKTLITSRIEGLEWFTGGAFGPEGSIQATVFCLTATIILLILCHKKGKIVKPCWNKTTPRR